MNNENEKFFSSLKNDVREYLELQIKITRLTLAEKSAIAGAKMISALVVILLLFFFLFFIQMGLAYLLSEYFGSFWKGFGLVGLSYLVILLLYLAFRRSLLEAPVRDKIIKSVLNDEQDT